MTFEFHPDALEEYQDDAIPHRRRPDYWRERL